jgi:hypothetical protein
LSSCRSDGDLALQNTQWALIYTRYGMQHSHFEFPHSTCNLCR